MHDNLFDRFIDELAVEVGTERPDASRLRRAATLLQNDWAGLQVVLKTIASEPRLASSVARRSYWHANGFAKLVIHESRSFSLRLHVWPKITGAGGWADVDMNVHTHRWEFSSVVLCGGLEVEDFEEVADPGHRSTRAYEAFEYDTSERRTIGQLVPLGRRLLRSNGPVRYRAGDLHDCELGTIHAVRPSVSGPTATLFLQGPVRAPAAVVYQDVGCAPLEDTGVVVRPDEVVELLQSTLSAMSYDSTTEMRLPATAGSRKRSSVTSTDAVLADHEIVAAVDDGSLRVEPFDQGLVRPAALSLRLGESAYVLEASGPVDATDEATYPRLVPRHRDDQGRVVVNPGEVVLAPTLERITVPDTLFGVLDGITDIARLGLSVVLAQQVSPGFGAPNGAVLTLEIVNHIGQPIYLRPAMRVCNLVLLRCSRPARLYSDMPYNHSRDRDAMPSRLADYTSPFGEAGFAEHTAPFQLRRLVGHDR